MITFNDCLSLAEIPEDLVEAISDHEHIPEIAAVELADHLLHSIEW